jgi:hypothetical protein
MIHGQQYVKKIYLSSFPHFVGGYRWKERVYNREEWKLLRTARNCCVLHMPME